MPRGEGVSGPEQERGEEQHAAVADGPHGDVGDQRARQGPGSRPCRNDAEEAPGLLGREELEQETPEHRNDEQVEDADEDVEELRDDEAALAAQGDADVDVIRRESVVLVDPLENPDGRARFLAQNRLGQAA